MLNDEDSQQNEYTLSMFAESSAEYLRFAVMVSLAPEVSL